MNATMRQSPPEFIQRTIIFVCLLILVGHGLALLSVRWHDDDLTEAALVQQDGAIAVIPYYWYYWSGRVGYALVVGVEKLLPETWAGVPLILMLALWARSCWQLGRERGLVVLTATLIATPQLDESLYWQSGATAYTLPLALFTFALVCVQRRMLTAIPALLVLFAAFLGDTMQVVQIIVLTTLWLLFPVYRQPLGIMLGVAIGGLIVVQLAPGNAYRKAYFPTPDLWLSFSQAAQTAGVGIALALQRALWAVAAVAVIGAWFGKREASYNDKRQTLIILLALITVNFSCQLAAYYATSRMLFMRAQIIPIFASLAGLCAIGGVLNAVILKRNGAIV